MEGATVACARPGSKTARSLANVNALDVDLPWVYAGGSFSIMGGLGQSYIAALLVPTTAGVPPPGHATQFALTSAPSPATSHTMVRFTLPSAGRASLAVYDAAGRRVSTLVDHAAMAAGPHEVPVSTAGLGPGLYFVRLEFGSRVATRKLVRVP
jgi:hypothetical protein